MQRLTIIKITDLESEFTLFSEYNNKKVVQCPELKLRPILMSVLALFLRLLKINLIFDRHFISSL